MSLLRWLRALGGAFSHADLGPFAGAPRNPDLRIGDEKSYSTIHYATVWRGRADLVQTGPERPSPGLDVGHGDVLDVPDLRPAPAQPPGRRRPAEARRDGDGRQPPVGPADGL
ncbi:hypothetical protein Ari01nite_27820 [Paractinoplanes rishiriensis]|uniref:Uncharacterized protein n=1 Tax=Paractinoplanes rishiriensis TaxID=1050105 RepID=A0A919N0N2_9ACTN|nr:hypothetical protein Ari01nite_27820 [Actinoplanes rishiriensis]